LGKGILPSLFESILHDHLVDNLSTENASPSEKLFTYTVEFFEDHGSTTTIALHNNKPPILKLFKLKAIFIPKVRFSQNIDKLLIFKKLRIGREYGLSRKFV